MMQPRPDCWDRLCGDVAIRWTREREYPIIAVMRPPIRPGWLVPELLGELQA